MNFLLLTELTPKKGARPDSETDSGHNDTLPSSSARSEDATSSLYDNPQPSTSGMGTRKSNNSSSSISIVSRVNVVYTASHPLTLSFLDTKPRIHISNDLLEWAEKSFNSYINGIPSTNNISLDMNQSVYDIPLQSDELQSDELYDPEDPANRPIMLSSSDPFFSDAANVSF